MSTNQEHSNFESGISAQTNSVSIVMECTKNRVHFYGYSLESTPAFKNRGVLASTNFGTYKLYWDSFNIIYRCFYFCFISFYYLFLGFFFDETIITF